MLQGDGTVDVVPPVTHESPLVEDGGVGAEEAVHAAVSVAHVEYLRRRELKAKF